MELKDQVCALEYGQKLRELKVKQESLFYWGGKCQYEADHGLAYLNGTRELVFQPGSTPHSDGCSAFTVAELGEMLPTRLLLEGKHYPEYEYEYRQCLKGDKGFRAWYENPKDGDDYQLVKEADTEANSRAKMLIYLLENKLIPPALN